MPTLCGQSLAFVMSAFGSLTLTRLRVALAFAAFIPAYANCQIYANADWPAGSVVLSNFRSTQTAAVLVSAATDSADHADPRSFPTGRNRLAPSARVTAELRELVNEAADRTEVSARLIHAVILAESAYDAKAVSVKGAIGLMQLLPETARRFGATDPYEAEQNVFAGASYLKWLMGLFGNDLELVLAAYNAGEQAVLKAGRRIPPFPETRAYVKRIMADLQRSTPSAN